MPRKKKQDVRINNTNSLEGLVQETYNDACLQISEVQSAINSLINSAGNLEDIDDLTKVYKEKSNLLKVKDSAIKIKLEIARLQTDIIKNSGNIEDGIKGYANTAGIEDDFKTIRDLLKSGAKKNSEENDEAISNLF